MERFLKGIIVGLGGIAPGLSGSMLLIIFGLYQKTLDALGNLFRNFRKNVRFLLPLVAGMLLGVLLFSRVVDFCLAEYEVPTRFCFLGLILGTLPMVWREVRKEGFAPRYYLWMAVSVVGGIWFFTLNPNGFPQVTDPTVMQSVLLGVAVAATAIIPGVDPAVFLSTLGFYEMYVHALAQLDFGILIPMVLGLALGAVGISFVMSSLFKRAYTATYSVIFGIFLVMIPNMLTPDCRLGRNGESAVAVLLLILGFALSWFLGDYKGNLEKLRRWRKREEEKH